MLYKLGVMNELRKFILESHLGKAFAKAVYESLNLLEAVNINKDFLIKEAGSPEHFKEARDCVQGKWNAENMNAQLNQKAAQKVLNLLYLMEIRKPGFTDTKKLHAIHDLYIHNMLDTKFLNVVNSDTTPEQADQALNNAVQHQVQQQKTYPDLSDEEEEIWNRVKVYHEFPDGFKWVYAVDSNGRIVSSIPSRVTSKTMNHCGNSPREGSDDQYWELRDADGKAYLTIILNKDGELEESKSWGNQVNKYRRQIQPYVKWFLMDKVKGVGHRYDYGYSTHTNYGVKDFIGDDPEFINYVTEFKPALLGNTEEKILFWKGAVEEGVVTVDQLKEMYVSKLSVSKLLDDAKFKEYKSSSRFKYDKQGAFYSNSVFGSNRFEVLCASCGECPFTDAELKKYINSGDIELEEFVNYDIHLLTPEMQRAFVAHDEDNYDTIIDLSEQVASFKVAEDLIDGLIDPLRNGTNGAYRKLLEYLKKSNPPEKVHGYAVEVIENDTIVRNMFKSYDEDDDDPSEMLEDIFAVMNRFPDLQVMDSVKEKITLMLKKLSETNTKYYRVSQIKRTIGGLLSIGKERADDIIKSYPPALIIKLLTPHPNDDDLDDMISLSSISARLLKEYGSEYTCTSFPDNQSQLVYMLSVAKEGLTVPGIENIAGSIVDGVRKSIKSSSVTSDDLQLYTLGLEANIKTCDLLETGELVRFMCIADRYGGYSIRDEYTPELIECCMNDLKAVYANPDKNIIRELAKHDLFRLLEDVAGSTPTNEFNEIVTDSLYMRATVCGGITGGNVHVLWSDMVNLSTLIEKKFIELPVEEWPKWIKLLSPTYFVRLYLCSKSPDALYDDPNAMGCIIRAVTGHPLLCPDSELTAPGASTADDFIEVLYDYVNSYERTRLNHVIAARLSPLVEEGKLSITPENLKALAKNGLINPRAYRKAMETAVSTSNGKVKEDAVIATGDIWRVIRSPLLPQLVLNTMRKLFDRYRNHTFGVDSWRSERKTVDDMGGLIEKLAEKRSYYQVMRAIQALDAAGIIDRMIEFLDDVVKIYDSNNYDTKMKKKYGWVYIGYMAKHLQWRVHSLRSIADSYKENPIPEPKTKTRKRKTGDGQTA